MVVPLWYSNEIPGENTRWEVYKNASCCFQQNLEAVPYKTAAVDHLLLISQRIQARHAGEVRTNS